MQRQTFIIRIWHDDEGHIWGQIVEPLEGQRVPFRGEDKLWQLLDERIHRSERRSRTFGKSPTSGCGRK